MVHPAGTIIGERMQKQMSLNELQDRSPDAANHGKININNSEPQSKRKFNLGALKEERAERNALRIKAKISKIPTEELLQELSRREASLGK